jgi:predicted glycoside hydrolase/deacetylase ChbG (UPF0249 family)
VADKRYLIVTADDYGIGPATSQGILELGAEGLVTATVLLVNSPHAEAGVRAWQRANRPVELGWHPCLTLDGPVLSPDRVPSLVQPDGRFWPLGRFLTRLCCGLVRRAEIEAELTAQHRRFQELVGHPPTVVNAHHHVQVFPPVGTLLRDILARQRWRPYLRRVREPGQTLIAVPGGRAKRMLLSALGRVETRQQIRAGFAGNDWLLGITNPEWVAEPQFLVRWLKRAPGRVVELTCHPGRLDETLVGRDCAAGDEQQQRRLRELHLLRAAEFEEACEQAGFTRLSPSEWLRLGRARGVHAA